MSTQKFQLEKKARLTSAEIVDPGSLTEHKRISIIKSWFTRAKSGSALLSTRMESPLL